MISAASTRKKAAPLFKSLRRRFLRKRRDGAGRRLDTERSLLQALKESQARTDRLFESNIVGIFYADERARITGANDAFLSMVGHGREALARGDLSWIELTPPGWEETDQRAMVELMATGACAPYEKEFRRADGSRIPVLVGTALLPGSDASVGFVLDLAGRKRAEGRAALLAEAGSALSESLDYAETLQSLLHLTVPRLADYGLIFELHEGPLLHQVALLHVDAGEADALRRLGEVFETLPKLPESLLWRAVDTGESQLAPSVNFAGVQAVHQDPEMLEGFRRLAPRSFITVPLAARGEILGVMLLAASVSGRNFGRADLELAEGLASRASLAIDNARLYGRAEAASKAKDHFLAALSHELRTPLTPVLMRVAGARPLARPPGAAARRPADDPAQRRAGGEADRRPPRPHPRLPRQAHPPPGDDRRPRSARARGGDLLRRGRRAAHRRSTSSPARPSATSGPTRPVSSRCSGTCSRTP